MVKIAPAIYPIFVLSHDQPVPLLGLLLLHGLLARPERLVAAALVHERGLRAVQVALRRGELVAGPLQLLRELRALRVDLVVRAPEVLRLVKVVPARPLGPSASRRRRSSTSTYDSRSLSSRSARSLT